MTMQVDVFIDRFNELDEAIKFRSCSIKDKE